MQTYTKSAPSFRLVLKRAFQSRIRFRKKAWRRGVRQFVGMIVNRIVKETNLFAVAAAPFADKQVKSQPEPRGQGQRMIEGLGLKPVCLTACGQECREPGLQGRSKDSQWFHRNAGVVSTW